MNSNLDPLPIPTAKTKRKWLKLLYQLPLCLLALLALAWIAEDLCGAWVWQNCVARTKAKGDSLEPSAVIPQPIPDEENFAAIPLFKPLFDYTIVSPPAKLGLFDVALPFPLGQHIWRDFEAKERLSKVKATGAGSFAVKENWRAGEFCDLAGWQDFYRKQKEFAMPAEKGKPGEDVLRALAKFDPELNAARVAAARPRSRFPVHYEELDDADTPHSTLTLGLCTILRQRAFAELSLDSTEQAKDDVLLGLRLSEAAKNEPYLISLLVHIAEVDLAIRPLWEGLARHQWSETQLAAFETSLTRIDLIVAYQETMKGERNLFGLPFIERLKNNRRVAALSILSKNGLPEGGLEPKKPAASTFLLAYMLPGGWFDINKAAMVDFYSRAATVADGSNHRFFPDVAAQNDAYFKKEFGEKWNMQTYLENSLLTHGKRIPIDCAKEQSTVDLARVAIALERFRLAHGGYPDSLDALAPAYLPSVPRDVVGGEPLHYRRDGERFILYSIGWNGVDDGGEQAWTKPQTKDASRKIDWAEGDWVWPQCKEGPPRSQTSEFGNGLIPATALLRIPLR